MFPALAGASAVSADGRRPPLSGRGSSAGPQAGAASAAASSAAADEPRSVPVALAAYAAAVRHPAA